MTDREQAEWEVNEGLWFSLRKLADLSESEGDATRAAGYRWLADHKRFPRRDSVCYYFFRSAHFRDNEDLPEEAMIGRPGDSEYFFKDYPTLVSVYHEAALYLGRWLEKLESSEQEGVRSR